MDFIESLTRFLKSFYNADAVDALVKNLIAAEIANHNDIARLLKYSKTPLDLTVLLISRKVFKEAYIGNYLIAQGLFEFPPLRSTISELQPDRQVDDFYDKFIVFTNRLLNIFLKDGKPETYLYMLFITNLIQNGIFNFDQMFYGCGNYSQLESELYRKGVFLHLGLSTSQLAYDLWSLKTVTFNNQGSFFRGNYGIASSFELKLERFKLTLVNQFKTSIVETTQDAFYLLLKNAFNATGLDGDSLSSKLTSLLSRAPLYILNIYSFLYIVGQCDIGNSPDLMSMITKNTNFNEVTSDPDTTTKIGKILFTIYQTAMEHIPSEHLRWHLSPSH